MVNTNIGELEYFLLKGMYNYKQNKLTEKQNGLFSLSEIYNAAKDFKNDKTNIPKYLKQLKQKNFVYMRTITHIDKGNDKRSKQYHGLRNDLDTYKKLFILFSRKEQFDFFWSDYYNDNIKLIKMWLYTFTSKILQTEDEHEINNFMIYTQYMIFSELFIVFLESEYQFKKLVSNLYDSLDVLFNSIDEKQYWVIDSILRLLYVNIYRKDKVWGQINNERGTPIGVSFQITYKTFLTLNPQTLNTINQIMDQSKTLELERVAKPNIN